MIYLSTFRFPTESEEGNFLIHESRLDMSCYDPYNVYPFRLLPQKGLTQLDFAPITLLYGGNGSGKSTVLNIIAQRLGLHRNASFNNTPYMKDYPRLCRHTLASGIFSIPVQSECIASDGVFDLLLDQRAFNDGIDLRRERLFEEYTATKEDSKKHGWQLQSLEDFEELKRRNAVNRQTRAAYAAKRLRTVELRPHSNGESAYLYFTQKIRENALYLLDEPENSLSAKLQQELARFLEDSARFYGCQFIISTHSPFLLAMKGARIYDLDDVPVCVKPWTQLENVRAYHLLFQSHKNEFPSQ